jgi:hypothetical protein
LHQLTSLIISSSNFQPFAKNFVQRHHTLIGQNFA